MKNKLKELSKYCCKPNEQEYEFIKTCARLGGVEWNPYGDYTYFKSGKFKYVQLNHKEAPYLMTYHKESLIEIPVTQFCDILLKDESEFEWKPKVGEWCAREWKDGDVDVFEVNVFNAPRDFKVSKFTTNGKKAPQLIVTITTDDRFILRQPTPEEIQTAIDAWDDRVDIVHNLFSIHQNIDINTKAITARDGYRFRISEDCRTVELIKNKPKCGFCVKPKNEER